jgi:hypothetical protein
MSTPQGVELVTYDARLAAGYVRESVPTMVRSDEIGRGLA